MLNICKKIFVKIRTKLYSIYFGDNFWEKTHINYTVEMPYSTTSSVCNSILFELPYFQYWTNRLEGNVRYHRKQWEYVYVCQTLYEHGLLQDNKKRSCFWVWQRATNIIICINGL